MSPVPARPPGRKPDLRALLAPLVARATEALADPVVRQRIVDQGQAAAGAFQRWRKERSARGSGADAGDGEDGGRLRVVHRRLERRERRLREVISALGADDPVLAVRLGPVVAELDAVVKALAVADALPFRTRRAAHGAIDDVLDRLDRELLQASLGLVDPPAGQEMAAELPPIRRISTGEEMGPDEAQEEWRVAAFEVLADIAHDYGATITQRELARDVQAASGIVARLPMGTWVEPLLAAVADDCTAEGRPILPALCLRADGTVGEVYAAAVERGRGTRPRDPEAHVAEERLACYRFHRATLPDDGGRAQLPPQEAERRGRAGR